MFVKVPLIEYYLRLRHNHPWQDFNFLNPYHGFFMLSQTDLHLSLSLLIDVAQLQSQLLALLKHNLLVHLVLSHYILGITLFVQIRTLMIQAVRAFEKESTILCSAE